MLRNAILYFAIVYAISGCSSAAYTSGSSADLDKKSSEKPNVVVIFTDDMGYGDAGFSGHPTIATPNLDELANEGQKWTSFYAAAPVCTPSRAALMTGRLPVRSGMASSKRRVLFPDSNGGIPQSEVTIAEALKSLGYKTGMVGKWHLGHLPEYLPTNNGFDSWYGIPYSNDMDLNIDLVKQVNGEEWGFDTWHKGEHWENPKPEYWQVPLMVGQNIVERAPDQNLLTKNYTEKAVEFIRNSKDEPFFLYLAHSLPHVPLFASDDFDGESKRGLYGDVIEEIDWSVGQVVKALKEEGVAENTLVVFTSDNGPWMLFDTQGGSPGLLRGEKGDTFEGGMRVPAVFWWPGKIHSGVVMDIGSTLDLLPTVVSLAGGKLDHQTDGYDLSEVIMTGKGSDRDEMFYYRGDKLFAVRSGKYKAHFFTQPAYGEEGPVKQNPPLLFNLDEDPSEKYNIADSHPNVIKEIAKLKNDHERSVEPVENQLEK
ncbi:sulfatase [Marinimicrobium sp. C6131]|uniref:sulfatase family protein n=1 Tax=Marinimicrobium sp. C6131 TaxID=3022676 RepID=UPI00223D722D|nr:sulfatase [Marinimicrobium sp. C6131]UZJ43983.1 sulfatase [Marinimicrobium sp. C6131]